MDKKELLGRLENKNKLVNLDMLNTKIDQLAECIDKIYTSVCTKDTQKESIVDDIPQHNLKKRDINQKWEDFRMDIFSEELVVDKDYDEDGNEREINSLEQMEKNIHNTKAFVDNFDKDDSYNLLFIGSTGSGKTFLANHTANILIKEGYTVRKYSTVELFDFINEALLVDRHKNLAEYKMITECDLLILDDLGTESIASFTKSHLFKILDARNLNCKKTIICSNLSIKEIATKYEERIFSRIVDDYYICKFTGEDLRFKVLKSSNKVSK